MFCSLIVKLLLVASAMAAIIVYVVNQTAVTPYGTSARLMHIMADYTPTSIRSALSAILTAAVAPNAASIIVLILMVTTLILGLCTLCV